jgi:hypothetical protein
MQITWFWVSERRKEEEEKYPPCSMKYLVLWFFEIRMIDFYETHRREKGLFDLVRRGLASWGQRRKDEGEYPWKITERLIEAVESALLPRRFFFPQDFRSSKAAETLFFPNRSIDHLFLSYACVQHTYSPTAFFFVKHSRYRSTHSWAREEDEEKLRGYL